jgi:hypothetical protein
MGVEVIRHWKELLLEGASLMTLAQACIALLLIELWGLKTIWKLLTRDQLSVTSKGGVP